MDKKKASKNIPKNKASKPKTKNNKEPAKSLKIKILLAVAGIIIIGATISLLVIRPWKHKGSDNTSQDIAETERIDEVDYDQKITAVDGSDFTPKITKGQDANLEMRFSELKCDDGCKNVENVEFAGKKLERDKDFEVRQGSVIIVIFAAVFSDMDSGEVVLTFDITWDNKIRTIGAKISIEDKAEESNEEQSSNTNSSNNNKTSGNSSSSSSSNNTNSAKTACEARTDGPVGAALFKFPSSAEKKAYISKYAPDLTEDDIAALVAIFYGDRAKMHYVNGQCVPSIGTSSNWTGAGYQPVDAAYLSSHKVSLRKNFVRWTYSNGKTRDEVMPNPDQIWRW